MGTLKRENKTIMFTFTHENMEPLFNQILGEFANAANAKNGCCSTVEKTDKWCSCLNLSAIPTKAEDLLYSCLDERHPPSRGCRVEDDRFEAAREPADLCRRASSEGRGETTADPDRACRHINPRLD